MKKEQPPVGHRGGQQAKKFGKEAQTLRDNPGTWFMLEERKTATAAQSLASSIRRGAYANLRFDGLSVHKSGCKVYIRYDPPNEEA